jgi:hypothetical protein
MLLTVLLVATGFAFVSTLTYRPYAIGVRDLWRLTAILWPPQVILCLAMRRLLLPLDESDLSASGGGAAQVTKTKPA